MLHAQTPPQTPPQDGVISGLGDEVQVTVDRWSAGQIGLIDAAIAAGVIGVAFAAGWLIRKMIHRYGRKRGDIARSAVEALGQLASIAILLFAIALALEILGFGLGPIAMLVLIVVFAVQLLRPIFTNMSTGLLLQLRRAFDLGDVIETHDEIGIVEEISSRTVVLRTDDNRRVHIPNSDVLESTIINHSPYGQRRTSIFVAIPLLMSSDDLELLLAARVSDADEVSAEPPVKILHAGIDGAWVQLEIRFWHEPVMGADAIARDRVVRELTGLLRAADVDFADATIAIAKPSGDPEFGAED